MPYKKYSRQFALGVVFTLSPLYAAIAQDQSEAQPESVDNLFEELIVTARKREESLADVPLSIEVFSNQNLKDAGLTELESLAGFTPNLDFQNVGNTQPGRWNSGIRFRGMEVDISTPTNQTGGFFVDGVPVLGGASSISFSDIGAIEVIRGPQPVYFGRGTFGGAINYTTVTPGSEFAGEVSASYSPTFGSNDLTGWVEGGSETLSARVTGFSRTVGSAFDSATDGGELGEENTYGVSAIVAYKPTDRLSIKTRLAYSEDDDGAPSATMLPYSDFGNIVVGSTMTVNTVDGPQVGTVSRGYFQGELPYSEEYLSRNTTFFNGTVGGEDVNAQDFIAGVDNGGAPDLTGYGLKSELKTASLAIDYDLSDAFTLSGLFGYSEKATGNLRDSDGYYGEGWITKSYLIHETTSAEVRISYDDGGALRAIAGISQVEIDQDGDIDGGYNFFPQFRIYGYGISRLDLTNIETTGYFASVEYDILDNLTAAVEARYQEEDIVSIQGNHADGPDGLPTNLSSESILPRFSLTYKPFESATAYVSYAEGELPGTVNNVDTDLYPQYQAVIDEQMLETIEFGWKQTLLSDTLFLSATYFTQEWNNMRATESFVDADDNIIQAIIPGSSTQDGIELSMNWKATDNLSVFGSFGYTNSEYDDYTLSSRGWIRTASNADFSGKTLPRSPKESGALGVSWEDDLSSEWSYMLRGDAVYRGETYADQDNLVTIASYTLFNLRANFESSAGIELGLYCDNCTDEDGWATATVASDFVSFFVPGGGRGAVVDPITPREIGVTVGYKF